MKKTAHKINIPGILISFIVAILFTYMSIDYFIIQPKLVNQIEETLVDYSKIKMRLDGKLPQIDSTLHAHSLQLSAQETQLFEINSLLEKLKIKFTFQAPIKTDRGSFIADFSEL
jgi:hypothetical protein